MCEGRRDEVEMRGNIWRLLSPKNRLTAPAANYDGRSLRLLLPDAECAAAGQASAHGRALRESGNSAGDPDKVIGRIQRKVRHFLHEFLLTRFLEPCGEKCA